jgi:hypothetical protein
MASIEDEELAEGDLLADTALLIERLRVDRSKPDIFSVGQMIPDTSPQLNYYYEWDNVAAIRVVSYDEWWEKRLPQEARKNVRRAAKRGVVVKVVQFGDELVRGIHGIYNETPVRQGKRFWHFGKDFETVKRELATYLDRSEFIGAYVNEELIGFIKFVYVDRVVTLLHILAKNKHHDKRPMNALLAKAVQLCDEKHFPFLVYGKYVYDGKHDSPLTEFKRRNGFEEIRFPRYYIPLSTKGQCALRLRLHLGLRSFIPGRVKSMLLNARWRWYQVMRSSSQNQNVSPSVSDRKSLNA